jgi:hypothetical protein
LDLFGDSFQSGDGIHNQVGIPPALPRDSRSLPVPGIVVCLGLDFMPAASPEVADGFRSMVICHR